MTATLRAPHGDAAAGCNHDGRDLRPPRLDQNATISTTPHRRRRSTTSAATLRQPAGVSTTIGDHHAGRPRWPATSRHRPGGDRRGGSPDPPGQPCGGRPAPGGARERRYGAVARRRRDRRALHVRRRDVSPPLSWTPRRPAPREIAITMTDEQNPTFVHWAIAGLDAGATGDRRGRRCPAGAIQARQQRRRVGYTGPCPPQGQTHTYRLTVHYLGRPDRARRRRGQRPTCCVADRRRHARRRRGHRHLASRDGGDAALRVRRAVSASSAGRQWLIGELVEVVGELLERGRAAGGDVLDRRVARRGSASAPGGRR